jgi:hypothetical protein
MRFTENQILFDTGKTITCLKEMFSVSENGIFRTMCLEGIIEHNLNVKEKREVMNHLIKKIDYLILITN